MRFGGWSLGLYLLIHFVEQYEWETLDSPHAWSVHFNEWDPTVPLAYGWGFAAFIALWFLITTPTAVRFLRKWLPLR
jgi:hypothetical protein